MGKIRRPAWSQKPPSEAESFALRIWAQELAEHYDLDEQWVEKILIKTAGGVRFDSNRRRKYVGTEVLKDFRPSIFNALGALPPDQVEILFSQDDEHLLQLMLNEKRWSELRTSPIPLQTFDQILDVANDFKKYLAQSTEDIVAFGEPLKPFYESEWLQRFFTDCKTVPRIEHDALDGFDSDSDIIQPPPDLPSFAEIMEQHAKLIQAPPFDPLRTYNDRLRPRRPSKNFQSRISLLIFRQATPAQKELGQKIQEALKTDSFVAKEKELRLALHHFSEDCFSHFVNVLKKRNGRDGVILAEKLVAECWNSFVKLITPQQMDVLSRKSLAYFGLPEYPRGVAPWIYSTTISKNIFVTAHLMEKIISGKWDEKIQKPLTGIGEIFVHEDGYMRFRCSYFQAGLVCGTEKLDAVLRSFENLRDHVRKEQVKTLNELVDTSVPNSADGRHKEVAYLDQRAIERIKAMGGYIVFPENKKKPTLIELAELKPREVGMINDCEAYFPEDGDAIYFDGGKQRTVIRFLFSKCDRQPKYSATLDEILYEVYDEETAKKILRRPKEKKFRIDNTWFEDHDAWRLRLLDSVTNVDGTTFYYLDFEYQKKPPRRKISKEPKPEENKPKKKGRGLAITHSKNVKKKKAV